MKTNEQIFEEIKKQGYITEQQIMLLKRRGNHQNPSPVHDANDVVASMRDNVYESITLKLGDGCTVDEIAREYNANKSFHDSMTDDHVKY